MSDERYSTSRSGVRLPGILYGTAWKKDDTERLVAKALRQGFRGVDTACQPKHYDEAGVGRGIANSEIAALTRGDLYVQTKFTSVSGQEPARIPYDPAAPLAEQVAQSFATSLRNLQTEYVDCLVLHSPMRDAERTAEVWNAMEAIAQSGGARQLGISNCYSQPVLEGLYRSASVKPAVVQNRFYRETGYDRGIRAFCREHGIVYQSFWTLTANPHLLAHAVIQALCAKYRRTPAQVLFRYLTHKKVVPLTGTANVVHMRDDLEIFDFELADEERSAVTGLLN